MDIYHKYYFRIRHWHRLWLCLPFVSRSAFDLATSGNGMINKRQFLGVPFRGILHQKAQRVDAPERGISYHRNERWVVNTPFGQVEIVQGDWLLELPTGRLYVIKDADMAVFFQQNKKWGCL